MNKKFLVILLQKDIHELSLLTEGFEKMTELPEPILRLAIQKAENILESLNTLGNFSQFELGEINYQTFADKKEDNIPQYAAGDNLSSEKNNFDALYDSELETPEPDESGADMTEVLIVKGDSEESDVNTEIENQQLSTHKRTNDVNESPETGISITLDEEYQEEIEVEEIGENEQVLVYDETDITSVNENKAPEKPVSETKKENVNERLNQSSVTLNESLGERDSASLSDSLANQKIEDIRQGMNIGDRFRFQRELFGSNGEVMNKTITYLNQLAKFEEAVSYLKSKFGWSDDNPHAEEFLQLIKRRYL